MHLLSIVYASALDCVCICSRLCLQPNRSNGASSKPVLDSLFWSGWPHLNRNRTEAGFSIDFGFRCTRWSAMHFGRKYTQSVQALARPSWNLNRFGAFPLKCQTIAQNIQKPPFWVMVFRWIAAAG